MQGGRSPHQADWSRRSVVSGLFGCALAAPLAGCGIEPPQLSLAIWRDYLGETTLDDFRRATGITATVTTYADNAELYARLRAEPRRFDLIVPSSPWVERLVREGRLARISHARLPNLGNLDPAFTSLPYDPGNAHSVPYTWLALGIGYRRSRLPGPPRRWHDLLLRPGARLALPADPAELFRLATKALGLPSRRLDGAGLARAEALLAAAWPQIGALHRDGGQDLLLSRAADVVALWNGDLAQVALEDPDIGFIVPQEGPLLSCDCLCIPAQARHPGNAHRLIDYLLSAAGGAGVAGRIWFPTPNRAARAILPTAYAGNPVLFPAGLSGGEFIGDDQALAPQLHAALQRLQVPQ